MAMVQVWVVRVSMHYRRMPVPMGVRLTRRHVRAMFMSVVFVMPVPMLMLHRVVFMLVIVPFRQVQP
jgi:hypothetical protein